MTSIKLIYFQRKTCLFLKKYMSQLRFRDVSCVDSGSGMQKDFAPMEKEPKKNKRSNSNKAKNQLHVNRGKNFDKVHENELVN